MMLRELGLSALFLFSLLASTAVAEPDTRINLKIEAEAKTESVRLATQIDYLVQPIDYTMNGNFEALTVGCLEDGVEVTSDAAEKVSFSARKGFNYLYTQLYASQDPTTGELIPFEDPVYFQAYGNQPQLPSQFDLKSPLAADAIIGAARLPVARIQTKLLKAVQAKKEEKIAGSPILPYSVIKMRPIKVLEQEAVPLDAPFNRSVSPFDEFINMIADAVGASADSPGTATRINADPIAAVVECQTAIPLDVAVPEKELAFKFRSRGIFEQQAVFRAETGEMFAFDQSTGRIAIAKGLSQDQEFTNPDQDYPQCGPIKYSAPVFIIANTEAEEAAGAAAIVSADNIPLLTMMIECEHGSSFALALSFDDGRILIVNPYSGGVLNIIERRCICTRNRVFPVWMSWCRKSRRLIVQYEKVERLYVNERETIVKNAEFFGATQANAENQAENQADFDDAYFATINQDGNRPRPNRYFVNIYHMDSMTSFESEPILLYTLRSCRIQFVRYCCCSGNLIVVLRDNLRSILVVFDENMKVVARKAVDSFVEDIQVTCCPTSAAARLKCECVIYMSTAPIVNVVRDQAAAPVEAVSRLMHVLCLRKVVDARIGVEANASLNMDGFFEVTACAQARAIVGVSLPVGLFADGPGAR